jgi:anaerobic ribonucleoside-triphosphate reductase activating protein
MLRIAGLVNDSIVDGEGLRLAVFLQGCHHGCEDCHNPHTHDPDGGRDISETEILSLIDKNSLLSGVTFTGGEPFLQAKTLVPLASEIKKRGLSLWIYSGFLYEQILEIPEFLDLLDYADVLVDGKFIKEKKTLDMPFVGSSNQRVIYLKDKD